ncbi:uncharacterized protein ASCRUDRAFT_68001 [Ascoidea rubescens DSM 1968]|uniref:PCI domain-containing protein n=1 Tax=Ascoidea rubescens DSM 1968 TaxID=1344418 RepID=A0A1D2VQS3_9ASCO|nr:hypothetical protein ASCRUDRAFT_68001 [Ascoidea rubescens DSM 1968]ODV63950.1 hypothetical protein ASCRUDRAFT_68001 [Ascoidea rubescens DSM 1968]
MSDNDDFMMSEEEDYEFEYESEDQDEDEDEDEEMNDDSRSVDFEARYYTAKSLKEYNAEGALDSFRQIIYSKSSDGGASDNDGAFKDEIENLEEEHLVWIFKSIKQSMKIYFALGQFENLLKFYQYLFDLHAHISTSYFESSIKKIIERYSKSDNALFLKSFYELPLLPKNKSQLSEGLHIILNIKKLNAMDFSSANKEAQQLIGHLIEKAEASNDTSILNLILQLYAIQLKVYLGGSTDYFVDNIANCKRTCRKALKIDSTIPDPNTLAVIEETKGKIYILENKFTESRKLFTESFKNYDEAGSISKKVEILKFLLILKFLSKSEIDIFESQELKPYIRDSKDLEILSLLRANDYYKENQILKFKNEINSNNLFNNNVFLKNFKPKIFDSIIFKVLKDFFKSFNIIKIGFLVKLFELNDKWELHDLIFEMIESNFLNSNIKLDMVNDVIEVDNNNQESKEFKPILPENITAIQVLERIKRVDKLNGIKGLYKINTNINFLNLNEKINIEINPSQGSGYSKNRESLKDQEDSLLKDIFGSYVATNDFDEYKENMIEEATNWLGQIKSSIPIISEEEMTQKEAVELETILNLQQQQSSPVKQNKHQFDKLSSLLIRNSNTRMKQLLNRKEDLLEKKLGYYNKWASEIKSYQEFVFGNHQNLEDRLSEVLQSLLTRNSLETGSFFKI